MPTAPRAPEFNDSPCHSSTATQRLVLTFGPFCFAPESLELWRQGTRVPLAPKPARLLQLLLSRNGRTIARKDIIETLWSDRIVSYDKSLNFAVLELRRALGDSAHQPLYIETMPRVGYRFVAEIRSSPDANGPGLHPQRFRSGRQGKKKWFSVPARISLAVAIVLVSLGIVVTAVHDRIDPPLVPKLDHPEALSFHLRGLDLLRAGTTEQGAARLDLASQALHQLEQATVLAPQNAEFWLALAEARLGRGLQRPDMLPLAAAAVERALALDPASARAHLRNGDVKALLDRDWPAAYTAYQKALELDPLLAETHRHLATHHMLLGSFDRSIEHIKRALDLAPVSSVLWGEAGWSYLYAGRPAEALRLCDYALGLDDSFLHARQCALYASASIGDDERFHTEALRILTDVGAAPRQSLPPLETQRLTLDEFHRSYITLSPKSGWERIDRALALAALGELDEAMTALEGAEEERIPQLLFRIRDPRLQRLQREDRFLNLMDRLDLEV